MATLGESFSLIRKIMAGYSSIQALSAIHRLTRGRGHRRLLFFVLIGTILLQPTQGAIDATAHAYNVQATAQMRIVDFFTAATQHRALGDYDSEEEAPPNGTRRPPEQYPRR